MGANYGRDMFNQLQEALIKIEQLSAKVQRIETETENKYLKIIYEKDAEIARLTVENATLKERVWKLETEVDRLRKQLNNNSSNSSTPPSQDQKPGRPNAYNSREKSGKKNGGQKDHEGHYLSKAEIEAKIASGEITHRVVNHGHACGNRRYISKYIIDIKLETTATEHRFYEDDDGDYGVPVGFHTDVQYGNELKTLAVTLVGQGIVASQRATEFIHELSSNAIRVSEGSIYNWLAEFDAKAVPVIAAIKTKLLNTPVMNIDETGARCEKENMFFRNYSDESHVMYTFNQTKGKKAIEEDGVLPIYAGTLVHDHNTVNYNYGLRNAECNVHIIRYLKANFECTYNLWSLDMIDFLTGLHRAKKLAMSFGLNEFDEWDRNGYSRRYDEIIAAGFSAMENTTSRVYKKEEKKLLNRLRKYKDNHLLFAWDFAVPFDNNESERDLRIVKTKSKVSGCFRSLVGAKRYANLMSIAKTAIKQGLSPVSVIRNLFASVPLGLG